MRRSRFIKYLVTFIITFFVFWLAYSYLICKNTQYEIDKDVLNLEILSTIKQDYINQLDNIVHDSLIVYRNINELCDEIKEEYNLNVEYALLFDSIFFSAKQLSSNKFLLVKNCNSALHLSSLKIEKPLDILKEGLFFFDDNGNRVNNLDDYQDCFKKRTNHFEAKAQIYSNLDSLNTDVFLDKVKYLVFLYSSNHCEIMSPAEILNKSGLDIIIEKWIEEVFTKKCLKEFSVIIKINLDGKVPPLPPK